MKPKVNYRFNSPVSDVIFGTFQAREMVTLRHDRVPSLEDGTLERRAAHSMSERACVTNHSPPYMTSDTVATFRIADARESVTP